MNRNMAGYIHSQKRGLFLSILSVMLFFGFLHMFFGLGNIYKSILQAAISFTWTERQPAGAADKAWISIASDSDGSNLIAAVNAGRLYPSSDSGANWTERTPAGASDQDWNSVASDSDGTNLIVGGGTFGALLYTSSDSGANWTSRDPTGVGGELFYTAVASDNDGSFLLAAGDRLYTSSDSGANWTERQPGGDTALSWKSLASDADGTNLIVAVDGGRLYTSSDSGANWTERQPAGAANINWSAVASDDDGTNLIVAVNPGRLYTSSDSGANWTERQPTGAANRNWVSVASDDDGSHLIVAASNGASFGRVYTSDDSGVTWTETQPAGDTNKTWGDVDIDATGATAIAGVNSGRLYTATVSANSAPTVSNLSFTTSTDGTGNVSVVFTLDDPDNDDVRAKIQYKSGSTCTASGLSTSTIASTVTSTYGQADITVNTTASAGWHLTGVTTTPGANTVTTTWQSATDVPAADGTYCVFVTVDDGTVNGTVVSSTVVIDNADPAAAGAFSFDSVATSSLTITYGAAATDTHEPVSDAYKMFYAAGASGVATSDTEFDSAHFDAYNYGGNASTSVTGLSANTQYVFNIWAYDTFGNNVSSTEITTTTHALVPGTPTTSNISTSSIGVSIDANENPATTTFAMYETGIGKYAAASGALTSDSAVYQTTSTWGVPATITGLTPNTQYTFQTTARNSAGVATAAASAAAVYTYATIPSSLTVGTRSASAITLSWSANSNPNGTEYYIEDVNDSSRNSGWITARSQTFSGLSAGTSYSFRVKARNADGIETDYVTQGGTTQHNVSASAPSTLPPAILPWLPAQDTFSDEAQTDPLEQEEEFKEEINAKGYLTLTNHKGQKKIYTNRRDVLLFMSTEKITSVAFVDVEGILPQKEWSQLEQRFAGKALEPITQTRSWTLPAGDGTKCVHGRFFAENGVRIDDRDCIILDQTPPPAPVVTEVFTGSKIRRPYLRGTAEPHARIFITYHPKGVDAPVRDRIDIPPQETQKEEKRRGVDDPIGGTLLRDARLQTVFLQMMAPRVSLVGIRQGTSFGSADEDGNWAYEFPGQFDPDTYEVELTATDQAGNSSPPASEELTVGEAVPEPNPEEPEENDAPFEEPQEEPKPEVIFPEAPAEFVVEDGQDGGDEPGDGLGDGDGDGGGDDGEAPMAANGEGGGPSDGPGGPAEGASPGSGGGASFIRRIGSQIAGARDRLTVTELLELMDGTQDTIAQELTLAKEQIASAGAAVIQTVQEVADNPAVEDVAEKIVAPTIIAVGAANVATGFQLPQLLLILRYLFTQPLLLFRRRKYRRWGVVYHAFTKRPVDLAIVRALHPKTKQVLRSQVTDAAGRYLMILEPGDYILEVQKAGFRGVSGYLKEKETDGAYERLYHGEVFTIAEKDEPLQYAIPIDPAEEIIPAKTAVRKHILRAAQYGISIAGVFVTALAVFIKPTPLQWTFLLIHVVFFVLFYAFAHRRLPRNWGVVRSTATEAPLGSAVVRLFDNTYAKLVDTHVTDRKGRYAMLVGPNTYFVHYEKPGYAQKKSPILDFTSGEHSEGGIIARDESLAPQKEKDIPPALSASSDAPQDASPPPLPPKDQG